MNMPSIAVLRTRGVAPLLLAANVALAGSVDLKPLWDDQAPLANPHKGWYHHYPDNHINKYAVTNDQELLAIPGMDHLYMRLAWAYLEPERGKFNWAIVDDLVRKWTAHKLGIAFRISCKETSTDRIEQQYATPKWVMEAGAKGGHYRMGKAADSSAPWEPVWDDPVFLRHLEAFLEQFAQRYDGQPWLRYVDIGSIGDWGEGHVWAGSRIPVSYATRKTHVDLHLKYFKKSLLMISDDFVHDIADPEQRRTMHEYVVSHGISYRDDSILVDGYFAGTSTTATVRSPEFFRDAYLRTPTVLELEHYGAVKRGGNWKATPGSSIAKFGGGRTGPDMLREALGLLHATYIGYHGYAAEWYHDNPRLTDELLNQCGYWYFPHTVEIPEPMVRGGANVVKIRWENRGVAPSYVPFSITLRLDGPAQIDCVLKDSGNRKWLPSKTNGITEEQYEMTIPADAVTGAYTLEVQLYSPTANRVVLLPLKASTQRHDGFYAFGPVRVGSMVNTGK